MPLHAPRCVAPLKLAAAEGTAYIGELSTHPGAWLR